MKYKNGMRENVRPIFFSNQILQKKLSIFFRKRIKKSEFPIKNLNNKCETFIGLELWSKGIIIYLCQIMSRQK